MLGDNVDDRFRHSLARRKSRTEKPGGKTGRKLQFVHFFRLRSLLPLCDLKFDGITLLESSVSLSFNSGIMDKNICPAILANESIAFGIVKPFHCSSNACQGIFLLLFTECQRLRGSLTGRIVSSSQWAIKKPPK